MDTHRRRFLAGLSARLDNERALRESEVAPPPNWRRATEQSDAAGEPAPMVLPAALDPAAGVEPHDRPTPAEVVPTPPRPDRRRSTIEALGSGEPDQVRAAAVLWSETGMPQALRDAIASVRRVSHDQLYQLPPPRSDQALYKQAPFDDQQPSFEDAETDEQPPFDEHAWHEQAPFDDAADGQPSFRVRTPHEEARFDADGPDEPPAFQDRTLHERAPSDDAADEQSPFPNRALHEEAPFEAAGPDGPPAFQDRTRHERAPSDDAADEQSPFPNWTRHEQAPFDDAADEHPPSPDRALHEEAPFGAAGANEPPAFRDWTLQEQAPFDDAADEHSPFPDRKLNEEAPFNAAGADEPAAFRDWTLHEQAPFDDGADEQSPFQDRALHERPPFDDGADEQSPFRDRALHERPPFKDEMGDEEAPFGDGRTDEQPEPGLWEGSHDRPSLRRGATDQRGLTFAAFALATTFVLLAGVGLGILSKGQELDRLLAVLGWPAPANETATSAAMGSARAPTGAVARPAEPGAPPQSSELVTVRVAPLPATPVTERSPAPATNGIPLPPPPKPAIPASVTGDGTQTTDPLASALDDAAAALLQADGAGGPFEPIFVKTPGSAPRVFVHYTESAAGGPATALHLVLLLKGAGFAVEARPVALPIPTHSVRYFFDADRDEAEALSASLEGQIPGATTLPVLDFTHYEPKPRPGLLELWLRS